MREPVPPRPMTGPPDPMAQPSHGTNPWNCLLYTSDAADERSSVDLGGRRIIKKKKQTSNMHHSTILLPELIKYNSKKNYLKARH